MKMERGAVKRATASGRTGCKGRSGRRTESSVLWWQTLDLTDTKTLNPRGTTGRSREYGTKGGRKEDEAIEMRHTYIGGSTGLRGFWMRTDPEALKHKPWAELNDGCISQSIPLRLSGDRVDSIVAVEEVGRLCEDGRLHEAIQAVECTLRRGFPVSQEILYCLLQGCSRLKDFAACRQMHSLTVRCGVDSNTVLQSHLIRMLVSCHALTEANTVFGKLQAPGALTWAAIISANSKFGRGQEAINLYHQMLHTRVKPTDYIYVSVLHACATIGALAQGRLIHCHVKKNGFDGNVYVSNTLIDMYAKCGSVQDAREVFNGLQSKDLVSWNSVIAGYAQNGRFDSAFELFEQLLRGGLSPDKVTFICLLKACNVPGALPRGKLIHARATQLGFDSDLVVGTTLIDMYSKCGSLEDALKVFQTLPMRDLMSWSAMVAAYARHGAGQNAIQLFQQMQQERVCPNKVILASVLQACTSLAALDQDVGALRMHTAYLIDCQPEI